MEAKELRIGNHINSLGQKFNDKNQFQKWENYVVKVDIEILKNILIENKDFKYSPIPLTEEWLLKFGFEKCVNIRYYKKNIVVLDLEGNSFLMDKYNEEIAIEQTIKSVHQLQNLYFALTGKELELK